MNLGALALPGELANLIRAGFTLMRALRAATPNAGQVAAINTRVPVPADAPDFEHPPGLLGHFPSWAPPC